MTFAGNDGAARLRVAALAWVAGLGACDGRDAFLGVERDAVCAARCFVDAALPLDTATRFEGLPAARAAEPNQAPAFVYPLPDSVHPLGIAELTLQWQRGSPDAELFRITFSAAGSVPYQLYVPCLATAGQGCRYALPTGVWQQLRDEFAGQTLVLGVCAQRGRERVEGAALSFSLTSTERAELGFYFWSAAPARPGTFRLPLGAQRAEPFLVPSSPEDEQIACIGCHSVSRDGSTIAYTVRGRDDTGVDQRAGRLVVVAAAAPDAPVIASTSGYDSSMMALTSDGRRVLVAFEHRLVLRTTVSEPELGLLPGDVIDEVPRAALAPHGSGYFPEFSPDDRAIALAVSDDADSPHAIRSGSIAVLAFDPRTDGFGALQIVVPGTEREFHFYPSWSPDGRYLAFVSAPRGPGQSSYDQRDSRLRLVRLEDRGVVELTRATQASSSWSTLPKFAPFGPAQDAGLFFLTFNSKLDYGLLLQNSQIEDAYKVPQLWLSALALGRLPEDPSNAPIWLPFQDFGQRSHLGFWAQQIGCREGVPERERCGPVERCRENVCVPAIR